MRANNRAMKSKLNDFIIIITFFLKKNLPKNNYF